MKNNMAQLVTQIRSLMSREEIEDLLSQLIAIPSPSQNEPAILSFVERYLSESGLKPIRQPVDDQRYNIVVPGPRRLGPRALFLVHTDTVPAYSESQLRPKRKGKYLLGRGACDTKGSLAATMAAAKIIHNLKQGPFPVGIVFVVGEEDSGDGVARFVRHSPRYDFCIVGEPTNLSIATKQFGYVEVDVLISGAASHAFAPRTAQPILVAAEILAGLNARISAQSRSAEHVFVRWIEGGNQDAFWYVRPQCKFRFLINPPPDHPSEAAGARLLEDINAMSREYSGIKVNARVVDWDEGVSTQNKHWGVEHFTEAMKPFGLTSRVESLPSWTDASTIAESGIPAIIFGPGALSDAHTDDEKVDLDEVLLACQALSLFALSLAGSSSLVKGDLGRSGK